MWRGVRYGKARRREARRRNDQHVARRGNKHKKKKKKKKNDLAAAAAAATATATATATAAAAAAATTTTRTRTTRTSFGGLFFGMRFEHVGAQKL